MSVRIAGGCAVFVHGYVVHVDNQTGQELTVLTKILCVAKYNSSSNRGLEEAVAVFAPMI